MARKSEHKRGYEAKRFIQRHRTMSASEADRMDRGLERQVRQDAQRKCNDALSEYYEDRAYWEGY